MALRITNQTKSTTLASEARRADNVVSRFVGLLLSARLAPGQGLWLIPCRSIHSLGMRFAFDAVFLNQDLVVVRVVPNLPPMRLRESAHSAFSVLELPTGTIEMSQTEIGDQCQIEH